MPLPLIGIGILWLLVTTNLTSRNDARGRGGYSGETVR
jgi:hypothetical protein